jgi:hypothetical protein
MIVPSSKVNFTGHIYNWEKLHVLWIYPDKTYHHPGQGLEVALVHPLGMLAEDMNQRIIQMRCVLHVSPP